MSQRFLSTSFFGLCIGSLAACAVPNSNGSSGDKADHMLADASPLADASLEVDPVPDASSATVQAIAGQRCPFGERIGSVTIDAGANGAQVRTVFMDSIVPPRGSLDSETEACELYQGRALSCDSACTFCPSVCTNGDICAAIGDGACVARPSELTGIDVTLSSGTDEQLIVGGFAAVEIPADALGVRIDGLSQSIELAETVLPSILANLAIDLSGTSRTPSGMSFSWTPTDEGASVFTNIGINHHVPHGSFVECEVDSSAGTMEIPGEMLTPLAVSTGLEFQSTQHVQFARADVSEGCIEFRLQTTSREFPR